MNIVDFLKECGSFKGRWNRQKFWLYPLGAFALIFLPLLILSYMVGESGVLGYVLLILMIIAYVFIIYVSIVSYIKRLHDLDKSGWMCLLSFVPLANIYLLVICGFFKGTPGVNTYGKNPLGGNADVQEYDKPPVKEL